MLIIRERITDRAYVGIQESKSGTIASTRQFKKFGVTLHWDGSGELLGIEFANITNITLIDGEVPTENIERMPIAG